MMLLDLQEDKEVPLPPKNDSKYYKINRSMKFSQDLVNKFFMYCYKSKKDKIPEIHKDVQERVSNILSAFPTVRRMNIRETTCKPNPEDVENYYQNQYIFQTLRNKIAYRCRITGCPNFSGMTTSNYLQRHFKTQHKIKNPDIAFLVCLFVNLKNLEVTFKPNVDTTNSVADDLELQFENFYDNHVDEIRLFFRGKILKN